MIILAILAIPLGLLMLVVGLKGIGRMLGFPVDGGGGDFYCTCHHTHLGDHPGPVASPCRRCPCPAYSSQWSADWNAQFIEGTRNAGH